MSKKPTKQRNKLHPLTLHRLIGELSFWGTFTRWLLLTVLAVLFVLFQNLFLLHVGENGQFLVNGLLIVLMVSIMFVFYDGLYVGMTRNLPLSAVWDRLVLFGGEIIFVIFASLASVMPMPSFVLRGIVMAPIFAVGILLIRLIFGVLWSKKSK